MLIVIVASNNLSSCKINASAKTIHFLGMVNKGFDRGGAHWSGHPEKNNPRKDLLCIGDKTGDLKIIYDDGTIDTIPLIFGATIWNFFQCQLRDCKEPFLSRPDCASVLKKSLKLKADDPKLNPLDNRASYFLSVKPRDKQISRVEISDNPAVPGILLLSGITLDSPSFTNNFVSFGKIKIPKSEMDYTIKSYDTKSCTNGITALIEKIYTRESDLPERVNLIKYPEGFNAARIVF